MLERRPFGLELIHLVLSEMSDLELLALAQLPAHRLDVPGQELGKGRLAVAVDADQRDAVIGVDAHVDVAQDRLVAIARRNAIQRQHGRCRFRLGLLEGERRCIFVEHGCRRLELFDHLHARLSLLGLGSLGTEPVHEFL